MAEDLRLYDSDTRETLVAEKVVPLADRNGEPIALVYTTAKRGRICQVQRGKNCSVRIHYFIDEPGGRRMIAEDSAHNGVSLATVLRHAPKPTPHHRPDNPVCRV